MDSLSGRRILLGVSGGIAAYKAAELVRLFVKAGAEVRVMMTAGAQRFITPLTLQSLSQHPVATDTFDLSQEATIGHIDLADRAELLVLAPATAHLIARLALGLADDVVTTVALATQAPVLVAPAMNVNMWRHPATLENVARLRARGVETVGPGDGELACGWVGAGRMAEPAEIFAAAARLLRSRRPAPVRDMSAANVLITAGPTYEALDPVRFIGNRSTGKMGFAIAEAAAARGAKVVLVAGPVALPTPPGVERIDVESAEQMRAATLERARWATTIVMSAAVADYRPAKVGAHKLKKAELGSAPSIALTQNPDILAEVCEARKSWTIGRTVIGFAAETDDVERRAIEKRRQKGCDLMVANDVSEAGSGFGSDTNRVLIVGPKRAEWLPQLSKREVADAIWDRERALWMPDADALSQVEDD